MKVSKRILAVLLSVLLLLPSFAVFAEGETPAFPNADPNEPYYVIGWLQGEGDEKVTKSEIQENTGDDAATYPNKVTTGDFTYRVSEYGEADVSIEGWDVSNLAFAVDVTYVRGDGLTGNNVLNYTGNQLLWVYGKNAEGTGTTALEFTGNPYITAFVSNYSNAAGTTVTYMIPWSHVQNGNPAKKNDVVSIDSFRWFVYNDSWKVDINGNGVFDDTYELQATFANARIVDTSRDGEGKKHGILASWADYTGTTTAGDGFVAVLPWSNPKTKSIPADASAEDLVAKFEVMYSGDIDASLVKNGQVRFYAAAADGTKAEYNYNAWGNDKTPETDVWYSFEIKLSEFYRNVKQDNGDGTQSDVKTYDLIAANIERSHIFNYNDNEGKPSFDFAIRNFRIVDTTVVNEEPAPEPTPVDRTALNEAIAAGEAALADETKDYTVDTETALQNAIDAGKAVAEDADQATVDAAAKAITDAITALEEVTPEPTVDKAALGALLAEVEGAAGEADKYTEDTVAALNAAYIAAKAVYDNAEATQDDVDAQVTALQAAIDGLELKPVAADRTALDKAIADAEAMLEIGNYTADTKAAVDEALAAAKAVAEDADQATIDAAAAALNDAVAALVVDPIQYVEIPMKDKGEDGVITSTETHGLSVYSNLIYKDENDVDQYAPIDLTEYVGCDLSIVFKMKLNVTENLSEALAEVDPAEWIKYIRNGSAILYTGYAPDEIKWASGEGGNPYKLICGEAGNLAEGVNFDEFVEIEIPVPQVITDSGMLTNFWILMYNDLHALTGTTAEEDGSKGVTLSVKDVFIKVDATNKVDKTTLQAAINAMLTDDELVGYTAGSIAKYKALYEAAQAVLDDEAATAEQVVAQVNVLKNATGVLVEDIAAGGTITLVEGEMNSAVAHYLSVNKTFEVPYNFAKYGERESIKLSFDIRVNKDEATFPEVLGDITDAEWLPYIVNGSIIVWTENATDDYKFSLNQQEVPIVLNCTKVGDLLETAIVGIYSNVTIDLPAEIVAAGTISKIEIYLYNDMNNLNEEAGNSTGVSISVKDINLIMGAQVEVDKTELQAAIDAEITDFEGYTEESVAAYQAALAAAKEVLANEAATTAQVAKALADLAAAALVPVPTYEVGDVDGKDGVTAADALLALQAATGKITLADDQAAAADADGVAGLTANDALVILQYATQKITSFPTAE